VSVNNTTPNFIYNKNNTLSGRHVSTFIGSSSDPLGKHIQELSIFQCIVGSQMLTYCVMWMWYTYIQIYVFHIHITKSVSIWDPTMHWNIESSWICFPRGPEDDPIKVETCRPDNVLFLLYIKLGVVLLTDTLYLYLICLDHTFFRLDEG